MCYILNRVEIQKTFPQIKFSAEHPQSVGSDNISKPTILPLQVGDAMVETKSVTKYMRIVIDSKKNVFDEIRLIADNAAKGASLQLAD